MQQFGHYVLYQQLQIHRIQRQLSQQIDPLGKMEVRTEEVYRLAVLDPPAMS
ncbi:MAG TPA: hypothetical protein VKE24_12745 [Candidatus Acidoferrales bacterium]|nr:hypothetical protein [Candidatus Acidoferrales bacterium]